MLIRTALAVILCGLLLTGCAEARFGSRFEKDGSAVHQLEVMFPAQALESPGGQAFLESIQAETEISNITFEQFAAGDQTSIRLTLSAEDGQDVGSALNNLVNTIANTGDQEIRTPFAGTYRRETGAFGGTEFVLNLTVDGPELGRAVSGVVAAHSDTVASSPGQLVTIRYVAVMPGEVDNDSNGLKTASNTVTWDIPFDRPLTISAESQVRNAGSTALFLIVGVALAVAGAALALLIGLILMRRRRLAERLVNTSGVVTPDSQLAQLGLWITRKVEILLLWLRRKLGVQEPPVMLLSDLPEEEDGDGAESEGDGSPAGVHSGGAGPEATGTRAETQPPRSGGHPH